MSKKITWKEIFKDFKRRYPNLSKNVLHWAPCDWLTIEIWMKDGSKMRYDYLFSIAKFTRKANEEKKQEKD